MSAGAVSADPTAAAHEGRGSADPVFHDVPFDGLEPERLVPTLPGLGIAMQARAEDAAGALAAQGDSAIA